MRGEWVFLAAVISSGKGVPAHFIVKIGTYLPLSGPRRRGGRALDRDRGVTVPELSVNGAERVSRWRLTFRPEVAPTS